MTDANRSTPNGLPTASPATTAAPAPAGPSQAAGHTTGQPEPAATPVVAPSPEPCRKCGSTLPPTARGLCPEPKCRAFRRGNPSRTDHGLKRRSGLPLSEDDLARVAAMGDAITADLGGKSEVSTVMAALIRELARTQLMADMAFQNIIEQGPLTHAGRKRNVVDLYLSASARIERLANQIGTARRTKTISSFDEAVRGA